MKPWHWVLIAAIALAIVGVAVVGNSSGLAAALFALLPAGREALRRREQQGAQAGAHQQAQRQTDAANQTRAQLLAEHARIDRETAADVDAIEREYQEHEGQPPSQEEYDRWVRRFGGR